MSLVIEPPHVKDDLNTEPGPDELGDQTVLDAEYPTLGGKEDHCPIDGELPLAPEIRIALKAK
jgi:hypothetical protein